MASIETQAIAKNIYDRYEQRTKGSKTHDDIAKNYLPGGDTRSTVYYGPHPTYMVRGEGCHLWDCDGNDYLDFLGNYTSIIHGHAHPKIIAAAQAQLQKGTIFGAPSEIQYIHAKHLCERVPSMDTLRYCNSGTEATQFALRGARAFTGRDVIMKMDGGYHGTHDVAEVNLRPDVAADWLPSKHVEPGVPACTMEDVVICPFNDLEAAETILKEYNDRLAAIIVEPIMGAAGVIEPLPGFLEGLRALADRYGVLLIFDEIITFRLNRGGMQAIEGVIPDMTTLGKIIGGGLPVGAFGGRKDVMGIFDPNHTRTVNHGGTFNGNNVTLGAGLATLELYDQAAIDRINELGDRLREGFRDAFKTTGIKGCTSGRGSLLNVHWRADKPRNAKESALAAAAAGELVKLLHLEMINRGIYGATRGMFVVSTAMAEADIDKALEAFQATLQLLKPFVAETAPQLLGK
jgi:glutamate-1-semialdehyde 2,1-aminomutase